MSRTLARQLPELHAALQRAAHQHALRWLSETCEAVSGHAAHPSRSAGHGLGSRQNAGMSTLSAVTGSHQRELLHDQPLGLALRGHSSSPATAAGALRRVLPSAMASRLLLASAVVPASHVITQSLHSPALAQTGCATSASATQGTHSQCCVSRKAGDPVRHTACSTDLQIMLIARCHGVGLTAADARACIACVQSPAADIRQWRVIGAHLAGAVH